MKWILLAGLLVVASGVVEAGDLLPKGTLVAAGGGTTTAEIVDKALELAGGNAAKVAIVAEAAPENGPGSLAMWKRSGAASVDLINAQNVSAAKKILADADLIWLPGGLQGLFMNRVNQVGLTEIIRERFNRGAVVAGTSAGAAVMSNVMIGGQSDLDSLRAGGAPYLMPGLGLWPEAIVDQHFLQKGRFNRLTLATIDYPQLIGVGIDEETAVVVHGHEFEVIGENNVTVIDARKAHMDQMTKGQPVAVRDLKIHLLRAGMKFNLQE